MKEHLNVRNMVFGLLHMLISIVAVSVITQVTGFNIRMAFLFTGISTIIFHIITQNKLPVVLGVSGLYVGSILYVVHTYGREYVAGGVILAGVFYIIFGLIMNTWQGKLLKYFPQWLLSMAVIMIGLGLIPIGTGLMSGGLLIGLIAFSITALCDLSKNKIANMFSMLWGLIAATIIYLLLNGFDIAVFQSAVPLEFIKPKFALAPALAIGLVSIGTMFEMLGDTQNTGDIIGKNIFEEVGLGRIFIGNGTTAIVSGAFNQNVYTTYSENAGFLLMSKHFHPTTQIFTAIFFIILAFVTPVAQLINIIPLSAFGGVVTYLFAIIVINAVKQLFNSGIDLNNNKKVFVIASIMVALNFTGFLIGGIAISSVAVAVLIGMILNAVIE